MGVRLAGTRFSGFRIAHAAGLEPQIILKELIRMEHPGFIF